MRQSYLTAELALIYVYTKVHAAQECGNIYITICRLILFIATGTVRPLPDASFQRAPRIVVNLCPIILCIIIV